ncbi:creatininase family protein [Kibdelosporangium philippinense]|uniref:Creatininase family protein n=1 Tax=Kibdelosporangium philippinense TaxID=211113 RepID=A0ABS8Z786_9PSEU|nr:creatininase family protein [Kibdelosporangium philippinense]MCE7002650.1 creatininase family protein [Kibdelosporangium philippinense]
MFLPLNTTVDVRDQQPTVAILPVGSHEQHGPILPLATDTIIASTVTRALSSAYPVLELPPITMSCSHEHAAWPGTVSISAPTLYAVVRDIAESLRRSGIGKLVLINGHGGNYVLSNVVQESTGMALFPTEVDWNNARNAGGIETPMVSDMHAGELEVSILLHAHPEVVRPDYAQHDHLADERDHMLTLGLAPYTKSGVIGLPSRATPEKGRDVLASLVASFAAVLTALEPS